ncbi:MAG: hypothetical protein LUI06_04535 [Ruminococcus sp.]|nr:hypothetical protein [Ruminococcus sp.]
MKKTDICLLALASSLLLAINTDWSLYSKISVITSSICCMACGVLTIKDALDGDED